MLNEQPSQPPQLCFGVFYVLRSVQIEVTLLARGAYNFLFSVSVCAVELCLWAPQSLFASF